MHNASSAILCHFFYGCEFGVGMVKSGGAKLPEKLESEIPDLAPITFMAAVSGRSAEESTRHESDQKATSKDTSCIAQQKIASCVFMAPALHWHWHIGFPSAQELLQNRRKTEKLPPRWRCLDQADSKLSELITWRRTKEMHCCRA